MVTKKQQAKREEIENEVHSSCHMGPYSKFQTEHGVFAEEEAAIIAEAKRRGGIPPFGRKQK